MKKYLVPVVVEVRLELGGNVEAYATDQPGANAKVQAQIEAGTLDDQLEFCDAYSGHAMTYAVLKECDEIEIEIQTEGTQVVDEDVSSSEVLEAEIEQLDRRIDWDAASLTKHRAFLQSLLPAPTAV